MASFTYSLLGPVFQWLWHKLGLLSRCIIAVLRPLRALIAITWQKSLGKLQGESEEEPPVKESEGQSGATGWDVLSGCEERGEDEEFGEETLQVEVGREEEEEFDSLCRVETTDEFYCSYDSTWETEERTSPRAWRPAAATHVSKPETKGDFILY